MNDFMDYLRYDFFDDMSDGIELTGKIIVTPLFFIVGAPFALIGFIAHQLRRRKLRK